MGLYGLYLLQLLKPPPVAFIEVPPTASHQIENIENITDFGQEKQKSYWISMRNTNWHLQIEHNPSARPLQQQILDSFNVRKKPKKKKNKNGIYITRAARELSK